MVYRPLLFYVLSNYALIVCGHFNPPITNYAQQMPGQQQQQQQPPQQAQYQQQQVPQPGGYGQPQPGQNLLHDKDRIHDREHIKEHLHGVLGDPDLTKLSEEELQFHYFKMHDNDNNNKLDGCELIKSLIHWHGKSKAISSLSCDTY